MEPLTRWLLTYFLHSTVLLGAVWLVRLALGERRLAVQEAVLRAALVGGFVTASLQIGLGVRPIGGALSVPATRPALALTPAPAPIAPSNGPEASAPAVWRGRPVVVSSLPPWASAVAAAVTPRWRTGLAATWAAALVALARLLVAAFRLRRVLRCRRPLRPGELAPGALVAAHALGLRRLVLSEAPWLSVPLATGVLRGLPALARHHAAWVLLTRLVEAAQRLGAPPPAGSRRVPERRPRGFGLGPPSRPRPLARGRRVLDPRRAAPTSRGGLGRAQRPQPPRPSRGETHGPRPRRRASPSRPAPRRRPRRAGHRSRDAGRVRQRGSRP